MLGPAIGRRRWGREPSVRFWTDDYGELFRAVQIEKGIMFVLLALIVAIAAFNIVSGQAMLVNDKRGDVAMLATMGASRGLLVTVFYLQGFAVAFIGVAVGLLVGVDGGGQRGCRRVGSRSCGREHHRGHVVFGGAFRGPHR